VLTGAEVPPDVGHFLVQALMRRAVLEGRDLIKPSAVWFDFESEAATDAVDGFVRTISQAAHFPAEDFDRALKRAVDTCCDYLVDPVGTLAAFCVTDGGGDNSVESVRRRTGYFLQYGYLLEWADRWLNEHHAQSVDRKKLSDHLRKLDRDVAAERRAEDWIELISPLVNAGRFAFRQNGRVPVELVASFLEKKDVRKLAGVLHELALEKGGFAEPERISVEIRTVLEPPAPPPTPPAAREAAATRAPAVSGSPARPSDLPLWKQFAREGQTTSDMLQRPSQKQGSEPLWKTYRPAPERESIESAILGDAAAQRDRFVRDIFGGDEGHYIETLSRLSNAPDWQTASSVLSNEVFRRHQVDIYSETAVAFTNAVERRVRQRS
jgi:hypothetical protein